MHQFCPLQVQYVQKDSLQCEENVSGVTGLIFAIMCMYRLCELFIDFKRPFQLLSVFRITSASQNLSVSQEDKKKDPKKVMI